MAIRNAMYILVVSAVLGLGLNLVSPNRIDYVGQWRDLNGSDGPIVPPSADAGDPSFIAVDIAQIEFNAHAVFIDAREFEEFECGTIPKSVNIPFDYLPEGDLAPYFDSALAGVAKDERIVVFCSGEECDASLHLARNMQSLGYSDLAIFFGGAREWERYGLPVERRKQCGD